MSLMVAGGKQADFVSKADNVCPLGAADDSMDYRLPVRHPLAREGMSPHSNLLGAIHAAIAFVTHLARASYSFFQLAHSSRMGDREQRGMKVLSGVADRRITRRRLLAPIYYLMGVLLLVPAAAQEALGQQDHWATLRSEMVSTIKAHSRLLPKALGPDGISSTVLEVMGKVPRHRFVPERRRSQAYADTPLPIGYGQTISQPFIVALMTHLLRVGRSATVLEIGTGSGYQAAVLSPLVKKVCTIEIISGLGEAAARRLTAIGYDNIKTRIGDGYFGWPECGPFDGILVTAAAGHVPPPLVKQLKAGGRMVIPVGGMFQTQHLTLVEKLTDGQIRTRQLLPVRFVPLTRGVQ